MLLKQREVDLNVGPKILIVILLRPRHDVHGTPIIVQPETREGLSIDYAARNTFVTMEV